MKIISHFQKPIVLLLLAVIALFLLLALAFMTDGASAGVKIAASITVSALLVSGFIFYIFLERKARKESLSQFIHDLRTPVTTVCGIAEILNMSKDKVDSQHRVLIETLATGAGEIKDILAKGPGFPTHGH